MASIIFRAILMPLLLGATAGIVALWSWRGRRVNDHPACRRCGYDLSGRSPDSERCPECGADLTRRRAIGMGVRERRKGLLNCATLVLAGAMGYSVVTTAKTLQRIGAADKPNWWLLLDARNVSRMVRAPAMNELLLRAQDSRLGLPQHRRLIDLILGLQADATEPWQSEWSEAVLAAQAHGRLADDQRERFWRQALPFVLRARRRVSRADPLVLAVDFQTGRGRGFPWHQWRVDVTYNCTALTVGGITCQPPELCGEMHHIPDYATQGDGTSVAQLTIPNDLLERLPNGVQRVQATLDVTVSVPVRRREPEPTLTRFAVEAGTHFRLLPVGEPSVTLVTAPDARDEMAKALSLTSLLRVKQLEANQQHVSVAVRCTASPARPPCFFDVYLRSGSREWSLGKLESRSTSDFQQIVTGLSGSDVDLVFRPNPSRAARTIDLEAIWGEEIVMKGVPVQSE